MTSFWTFLWLFVYNLQTPVLIGAVIGLAVCSVFGTLATQAARRTKFGELENRDAIWKQMMAIQSGIGLVILCCLVFAIPSPTYNLRVVHDRVPYPVKSIQYVEKKIVVPGQYGAYYQQCVDSYKAGNVADSQLQLCHTQALEATSPPKIIYRTTTVTQHDSFKDIFDACISNNSISDSSTDARVAELRVQRIAECTKASTVGSHDH